MEVCLLVGNAILGHVWRWLFDSLGTLNIMYWVPTHRSYSREVLNRLIGLFPSHFKDTSHGQDTAHSLTHPDHPVTVDATTSHKITLDTTPHIHPGRWAHLQYTPPKHSPQPHRYPKTGHATPSNRRNSYPPASRTSCLLAHQCP